MEFVFTEEQTMIAETVRGFFVENASSERTRKAMEGEGIDRALWSAFCTELCLSGIGVPEEMGGAGLGLLELAIVAESAGAQVAAIPLLGHAMVARALVAGGSAQQQAHYLPRLIAGEMIAAYAAAPAVEDKDGAINAVAQFVAHGAAADLFLVASGDRACMVERGAEGVMVEGHVTMDQTRPLATLTLSGAAGELLADGAAGVAAAEQAGWLVLSAEALGAAQQALDTTVAYAKERVQFGRAIGSFQAYKHRLADIMVAIEQARSAVYWAGCAVDEGSDEATLALHAAKAFCGDTAFMAAGNMVQLHGGIGFTWEHDAHLYFKRARSILSMLGSSDWHREQIAGAILGDAA